MIIERQLCPLPGTRLAASREQRHWPTRSRAFWAEVARIEGQDKRSGWPVKTFLNAPKLIRGPYSPDYTECSCGAGDKDACTCIRETMRSNTAGNDAGAVKDRISRTLAKLYPGEVVGG